MSEPITIQAILNKATTTIDGGWRISFDLAHKDSDKVTEIAKYLGEQLTLVIMTESYIEESK